MKVALPLEVLGLIAPILSRVERSESLRLPSHWRLGPARPCERRQAWLRRELPTCSRDTVDEILQLAGVGSEISPDGNTEADGLSFLREAGTVAPPRNYDLVQVLNKLGQRYFQWKGNELCVRVGHMEELHEFSKRLPVAHLIRHSHARAVVEGFLSPARALQLPEQFSALHTASRSLRVVVERGLVEGHLHLKGVTNADEVWADFLLSRVSYGTLEKFSAPEARLLRLGQLALRILALAVFLARRRWARKTAELPFRLLSGLDRIYLAKDSLDQRAAEMILEGSLEEAVGKALTRDAEQGPVEELGRETERWILSLIEPATHRLLEVRDRRPDGGEGRGGIRHRLRSLERLHLEVQRLLIELSGAVDVQVPRGQAPIARDSRGRQRPHPAPVRTFLHQAFFRYLVCHTHHMQLATQRGTTTGLREFKEYYEARQRKPLDAEGAQASGLVLDRLFAAGPVEAVEGRVSPPKRGASDLMPWVLGFACGSKEGKLDKFGLIIHFIKLSHDMLQAELRAADASDLPHLPYERYRHGIRKEAFRIFHLLSRPHPVVPFIVGLDAANEELTTPPEVLAPALRFLRDFPIEIDEVDSLRTRFGVQDAVLSLVENRRLGLTYHVGEEFRHLLSGLRAIHEVIAYLNLKPGDRLGHATALALDPEVWAAQAGYQAVLPKQEWLDTLVWVHHFLGPGHDLVGELEIEDRIQSFSSYIYGREPWLGDRQDDDRERGRSGRSWKRYPWPDWTPLALWDAWQLRQLDPMLFSFAAHDRGADPYSDHMPESVERRRWLLTQRRIYKRIRREVGSGQAYHLLQAYWLDRKVQRRGHEITKVEMHDHKDRWMQVCRDAQTKLIRLVRERQLVVEVNPCSNWLIGPMSALTEHHVFNLTLDREKHLTRTVMTTVNSDDPGVFNTSLAHEYYLLGEIMLRKGYSEARVMEWLEWLRRNGHDYTFLRFLPEGQDPRVIKIREFLQGYESPIRDWLRGEWRILKPEIREGSGCSQQR